MALTAGTSCLTRLPRQGHAHARRAMTMSALYMWPWVAALTVAAAAPSCSVRLYPHLARPQDHPTFATRAARPLLPEDLASVPVWGGPRGMPPGVRQDPTNASAVSEFLGLFEQPRRAARGRWHVLSGVYGSLRAVVGDGAGRAPWDPKTLMESSGATSCAWKKSFCGAAQTLTEAVHTVARVQKAVLWCSPTGCVSICGQHLCPGAGVDA